MDEKLARLYKKLVNSIIDMIPVEWDDVNYLGEVKIGRGTRSCSAVFYFKDVKQNVKIRSYETKEIYGVSENTYMELLMKSHDILLEIFDCFVEYGQKPWQQLSLYFNAENEFKVEFFYDVMNNEEGPLEREAIWAYHTFGYIAEEGDYLRKLLDEYLKKQANP